jgi:O-antigen/teichoic acid export membrane protein
MYVMVLLSSFGTHYLPTLSGAKTSEEIRLAVTSVFRVATLVSTPLICTAIVFKPWLVTLLYSREFVSTVELLRWTMLGDYLKISGWVFGMLLIARAERRWFALSELAWQGTVLGTVALFLHHSHETVGMVYLFANSGYLLFVWLHAHKKYSLRIDKQSIRHWLLGLAMVALLSLLTWKDVNTISPFALAAYLILLPFGFLHVTSSVQRSELVEYIRRLGISNPESRNSEK